MDSWRFATTRHGEKVHVLRDGADQMDPALCGTTTWWDFRLGANPDDLCVPCRKKLTAGDPSTPEGSEG